MWLPDSAILEGAVQDQVKGQNMRQPQRPDSPVASLGPSVGCFRDDSSFYSILEVPLRPESVQ